VPRKICVLVTARPSYARIRSVLTAIDRHPDLELQLVLAGSALLARYGGIEETVEDDGFQVAAKVHFVVEGGTPLTSAKTTGLALLEISSALDILQPDVIVTVADRFETIATALAAVNMNIPLAHVQGGEVTGNIDDKIRHAVTKLADIHFVAHQLAYERVIKMGEDESAVFNTGCPSIDVAKAAIASSNGNFDPFEHYGGVGPTIRSADPYAVVLQHPVTDAVDHAQSQVEETLHAIHDSGLQAFWFWPNIDAGSDGTSKGIRQFREAHPEAPIHFFRGMRPEHFIRLINESAVLVGNSSAGIREASYLGVPAIDIGTRQSGRLKGPNVVNTTPDRHQILTAIREQIGQVRPDPVSLYGDGGAGEKIAEVLVSTPLRTTKKLTY
jgi:bifunctional UDP-N-acetylglucosamine 2-epimerase / N-acetylmannosamine kinase